MSIPSVIKQQIGFWSLVRMGAHEFTGADGDGRSTDDGHFVSMPAGLQFRVNTGMGSTKMLIAYEPDDTYTIRLVKCPSAPKLPIVLETATDVYCDTLASVAEDIFSHWCRQ